MTPSPAWAVARAAIVVALAMPGASCREPQATPPADVPPPTRRHVAKQGSVRPLPPHAIGLEGVGPYHLGEPMAAILADMPGGPRLNVLEIPGVADVRLARVEEGSMLVGGQTDITFIGIVRRDIARIEGGLGIGTPSAQLLAKAGEPPRDPHVLRGPGLQVLPSLPNLRLIAQGPAPAPIVAMLMYVGNEPARPAACSAPALAVSTAVAPASASTRAVAACVTEAGDMVLVGPQALSHWVVEGGKWRRNAVLPLGDVVLAGPLRTAARHDDVLVIERIREAAAIQHTATLWRLEGTRFVRVSSELVYRIDAMNAAAIGASLADLELAIEAFVANGQVQLGGALLVRAADGWRDVVPLLPAYVPLRRRGQEGRPAAAQGAVVAPPAPDAGAAANDPDPAASAREAPPASP